MKKIIKTLINSIISLFAVFLIIGLITDEKRDTTISIVIITMISICCAILYFVNRKKKGTPLDFRIDLPILYGLNIPERTLCSITYTDDTITISALNNKFTLNKSKINDISLLTDTQVQNLSIRSAGGALLGGGILLGVGVQNKKVTSRNKYLIVSYLKEEEINYIGFEVQNNKVYKAMKIAKHFSKNNTKELNEIEI